MGWFDFLQPGDSPAAKPSAATSPTPDSTKSSIALTEEQRMRVFGGHASTVAPSAASKPSQPSREQQADAELNALIAEFQAADPAVSRGAASHAEKTALPAQDHNEPKPAERILPDGRLDISPAAVYPRTMSCRQQFDQAFYCQSLGGKFNDIYRYGHLRSCSENWNAFWFCMRTRTLPEKEREDRISQYYQERDERRKREHGSSEDIWDIRTVAVERAFWRNPSPEDG
jgi:hypothetical protein